MKASVILTAAAKIVIEQANKGVPVGGCEAISEASGWYTNYRMMLAGRRARKYFEIFNPDPTNFLSWKYWWRLDDVQARVMGLLFAAAIAESKGD